MPADGPIMTTEGSLPLDANEADVIEQRQPVVDEDVTVFPDQLSTLDADPADALDQHRAVPVDDDW